jgi:hypothetical protein
MKKTILILATAALGLNVNAQKVALHSGGNVSIFNGTTALVDAYNQSVNGDTIYLPGGGFTAPTTINKKLTIYGAGHYVDSTQATGKTFWNGALNFGVDADQFTIEGVEITSHVTFPYNGVVNNVTIARCKINGGISITGTFATPSNNLLLYNNVITQNIDFENAQNALVVNNIIGQAVRYSKGNSFLNNVFIARDPGGYYRHFDACDNNMIYNNVFYLEAHYGESGNNNDFRNNLYTTATPGLGTNPTSIGNYFSVSETAIFVNVSSSTFSYTANYHLQSPATYLGTDGSEIGIYGGIYNPYKEGAVPSNPHIQFQNIAPSTTNGLLNVQIKAAAQEN